VTTSTANTATPSSSSSSALGVRGLYVSVGAPS
jgi:hypothetical protein